MFQCLRFGDGCQLLHGAGAERTSGGSQYHFFYLVAYLAGQALENGGVLGVDGQDGDTAEACQVIDELSRHHQRLFVGKGYRLTGSDGIHGGLQPCISHHGGQYHIDGIFGHNLAEGICAGIYLDR